MKHIKTFKIFETFTLGKLEELEKTDFDEEISYIDDIYELDTEFNDKKIIKIIKHTLETFKKDLPFWDKIHVQFVKNLGENAIGMYIHDTCFRIPIILLSNTALNIIKKDSEDFEWGLKMTIIHELGHAIVNIDTETEFIENDNILHFEDEEEFVENFAFDYLHYGQIPEEVEELLKAFKK